MDSSNYTINTKWESNRKGILCSPEINKKNGVCIEVATPAEFTEGMDVIWSAEHLFVAAVSGCLMTTFLAIAANSSLEFTSFSCQTIGKVEKVDGKIIMSEVILKPLVVITSDLQRNKAIRILKKSENSCLIRHSIKSKITMEVQIKVDLILIETE